MSETEPQPRPSGVGRPTVVLYLEMCRMETAGKVHTPEYRTLSEEYHAAIDREIKAGLGV